MNLFIAIESFKSLPLAYLFRQYWAPSDAVVVFLWSWRRLQMLSFAYFLVQNNISAYDVPVARCEVSQQKPRVWLKVFLRVNISSLVLSFTACIAFRFCIIYVIISSSSSSSSSLWKVVRTHIIREQYSRDVACSTTVCSSHFALFRRCFFMRYVIGCLNPL